MTPGLLRFWEDSARGVADDVADVISGLPYSDRKSAVVAAIGGLNKGIGDITTDDLHITDLQRAVLIEASKVAFYQRLRERLLS